MKSPKHQCFGLSMFSENSNQKKSDSFEDPCIFYRCYFFECLSEVADIFLLGSSNSSTCRVQGTLYEAPLGVKVLEDVGFPGFGFYTPEN